MTKRRFTDIPPSDVDPDSRSMKPKRVRATSSRVLLAGAQPAPFKPRRSGWASRTEGPREDTFQRAVMQFAKRAGWRVAHFRKTRTVRKDGSFRYLTAVGGDGVGWPDLTLVHPTLGLAFIELKANDGYASDEQREWLEALTAHGIRCYVVRPRDWEWLIDFLCGKPCPVPDPRTPGRR